MLSQEARELLDAQLTVPESVTMAAAPTVEGVLVAIIEASQHLVMVGQYSRLAHNVCVEFLENTDEVYAAIRKAYPNIR